MRTGKKTAVSHRLRMRDVTWLKPRGFEHYFTLTELSREIDKTQSWLRKLEKDGRIPKAKRVPSGNIPGGVRLWSPKQVEEIREIISKLSPGRPRKNA